MTYQVQTELLVSNSIHLISFLSTGNSEEKTCILIKSHLGVCRVELNIAGYHFLATVLHMQTYFLKSICLFLVFLSISTHCLSYFFYIQKSEEINMSLKQCFSFLKKDFIKNISWAVLCLTLYHSYFFILFMFIIGTCIF